MPIGITENTLVRDLPFPYDFEVESSEGPTPARIVQTPDEKYFGLQVVKPFQVCLLKLQVWQDIGGEVTIAQVRELVRHLRGY